MWASHKDTLSVNGIFKQVSKKQLHFNHCNLRIAIIIQERGSLINFICGFQKYTILSILMSSQ